jgi:hypothetical protein
MADESTPKNDDYSVENDGFSLSEFLSGPDELDSTVRITDVDTPPSLF